MSGNRICDDYFAWLYDMVCSGLDETYVDLLRYLHSVTFEPIVLMDTNRSDDGLALRYNQYGVEKRIPNDILVEAFRGKPCSMLEMMIALAQRCDNTIMYDHDLGDRTAVWFWNMVDNLGLSDMYDPNFDALKAGHIMYIFMNRRYKKDGTGGLFKIHDDTKDMREIEIWYQMCFYLDEILNL